MFSRAGGNIERGHGNMLLSDSQEDTLLLNTISFSAANILLDGKLLRNVVGTLWGLTPCRTWPSLFLERHAEELAKRTSKSLSARKPLSKCNLMDILCLNGSLDRVCSRSEQEKTLWALFSPSSVLMAAYLFILDFPWNWWHYFGCCLTGRCFSQMASLLGIHEEDFIIACLDASITVASNPDSLRSTHMRVKWDPSPFTTTPNPCWQS